MLPLGQELELSLRSTLAAVALRPVPQLQQVLQPVLRPSELLELDIQLDIAFAVDSPAFRDNPAACNPVGIVAGTVVDNPSAEDSPSASGIPEAGIRGHILVRDIPQAFVEILVVQVDNPGMSLERPRE